MSKLALIAAAAAAVLAAPVMSSKAEAGGCGGYGGGSYGARSSYQSYRSSSYAAPARRVVKPKAHLAVAKTAVPKTVRTAAYQSKSVVSDAAPVVYVPDNPSANTPILAEAPIDQEASKTKVAALEPVDATEKASNEVPAAETVAPAKKVSATRNVPKITKRVCRRYSAATGGMVDVACE